MEKNLNVVMIVADQLNFKNLGCYGNNLIKTPNIDKISRSGLVFTSAYCQAPLCMPSRASFNTGLYPHTCQVKHNPSVLDNRYMTLSEIFAKNGYKTAGFGHIGGDGIERGFKTKKDLPDEPLNTAWKTEQKYVLDSGGKEAFYNLILPMKSDETFDGIASNSAIDFIAGVESEFFLQLDFYKPHPPLTLPEDFAYLSDLQTAVIPESSKSDLTGKPSNVRNTRIATGMEGATTEEFENALKAYYCSITYIDSLIGKVMDALNKKGILDDTIIVFTADHGDYAGEYGIIGKTGNFYDCLVRVPLIISCSGMESRIRKNEKEDALVELIDIFPTLAKACNLEIPLMVQGTSRWDLCTGKSLKGAESVFCETSGIVDFKSDDIILESGKKLLPTDPFSSGSFSHISQGVMIRKGKYKLSIYSDGFMELYDIESDESELYNLANNIEFAEIISDLTLDLLKKQITTYSPDIPQSGLAYHHRATYEKVLESIIPSKAHSGR